MVTTPAAVPQGVLLKMNGKRNVFRAAPHLAVVFIITNSGQPSPFAELFVLEEVKKKKDKINKHIIISFLLPSTTPL